VGVTLLILTVVRLLSFFFTSLFLTLALTSCAQKSAESEEKVDIPKPTVAAPPLDTRPVILCFGDSITAGYGIEAGQTYPDILQQLLDKKGFNYRVVNSGISGDTTQGGLDRLTDAIRLKPRVTLLELGGNDGLRGIALGLTRDNLVQIAARLEASGSKIVILGITLPRNYGPDYIRQFEANYRILSAEKKYAFMPFVLEGVYGGKSLMQTDGIHPTAAGAAVIANNVLKYLEPLLDK